MTALIAIAVLAFVIYCFLAEWNCSAKNSPTIVTILCRLVARHIKLVWKLFVGLIYFAFGMICIFEMNKKIAEPAAPEGGFARFMDVITTPVQLLVDGFVGLLGLLAVAVLFGLVALKDSVFAHPYFWLAAVIATYLLWLLVTICDLVEDEVVSSWKPAIEESRYPSRVLSREDYISWSMGVFFLWMAILAMTGAWLASRILV